MILKGILLSGLIILLMVGYSCSQPPPPSDRANCENPIFDKKVASYLNFTVPTIGVETLDESKEEFLILDARKKEEFEISHIKNAKFCGFKDFDTAVWEKYPKDTKIVVYCSIGYRSEKIGEKLQKLGFINVYNLYGSLFEWVNQEKPIVDKNNQATKSVHTYNRNWSKWVENEAVKKIW